MTPYRGRLGGSKRGLVVPTHVAPQKEAPGAITRGMLETFWRFAQNEIAPFRAPAARTFWLSGGVINTEPELPLKVPTELEVMVD